MRSNLDFKYQVGLNFSQKTASGNGNIIDRQGYESVTFIVATGAVAAASAGNTLTVSLEHGDEPDLSDAEAVTAANGLLGSDLVVDAVGDANKTGAIGYVGGKRYIRPKVTDAGVADAFVGVIALLGHGTRKPEADYNTFS